MKTKGFPWRFSKDFTVRGTTPRRGVWNGLKSHEAGQNLVEMALLLPVLLLILLGIIDFSRVFYAYIGITNAAREGARYGSIHPGNVAAIRNEVVAEVAGTIALDTSQVTVSFPYGTNTQLPVIVTVQYPFSFVTPLIGNIVGNPLQLQSSATMAVANIE